MGNNRAQLIGLGVVIVVVVIVVLVGSQNPFFLANSLGPTAITTQDEDTVRTKVFEEMTATGAVEAVTNQAATIEALQAIVATKDASQVVQETVRIVTATGEPSVQSVTATAPIVIVPSPIPQVVTATPQPVQPTQVQEVIVVTATPQPIQPTQVREVIVVTSTVGNTSSVNSSSSSTTLSTFIPASPEFGIYATDVSQPTGYSSGDCGRIWQATNGQNLAWTTIFCRWQSTNPAPQIMWTIPTKALISGSGTLSFELWRDIGASQTQSPDPYVVANAAQSRLGLAWFIRGTGGDVCVNGNCKQLEGGKTYQLGFPHGMNGFYAIAFTLSNGNVEFWQGEKINSRDDWPVSEECPTTSESAAGLLGGSAKDWDLLPESNGTGWKYNSGSPAITIIAPSFGRVDYHSSRDGSIRNGEQATNVTEATFWCDG